MSSAVIFDLDGTLLDTLRDLAESTNEVLAALGHAGHDVAAYRYLVGEGMEQLVRRALPAGARDEPTVGRALAALRRVYADRWHRSTRVYNGVPELLDALAALRLPVAILSNKPDDFTRAMAARFLSRWPFAAVTGARPGVPRKPDPLTALATARTLGTPPADVLFLGDTRVDMETAAAAGMVPVGALWGFREADELLASGARHLVRQPGEVLALVTEAPG